MSKITTKPLLREKGLCLTLNTTNQKQKEWYTITTERGGSISDIAALCHYDELVLAQYLIKHKIQITVSYGFNVQDYLKYLINKKYGIVSDDQQIRAYCCFDSYETAKKIWDMLVFKIKLSA